MRTERRMHVFCTFINTHVHILFAKQSIQARQDVAHCFPITDIDIYFLTFQQHFILFPSKYVVIVMIFKTFFFKRICHKISVAPTPSITVAAHVHNNWIRVLDIRITHHTFLSDITHANQCILYTRNECVFLSI